MSAPTSSSSSSPSPTSPAIPPLDFNSKLSIDEIGKANTRAQIDGVAAGTCAGFLSGFMSTKLLKQSRNLGLLSGLITGSVVGYLFTQESLKLNLAKARKAHVDLQAHLSPSSASTVEGAVPPETWDLSKPEGGHGGQEGLTDRWATTRGDH
ncbi:hypothetical protein JCM8097_006489 [Rhodosporidiobolus ruineniae]